MHDDQIKNDTKPFIVKILLYILTFKISVIILVVIAFVFLKDLDLSHMPFFNGIRTGIIESYDLRSTDMDYNLGILIGSLLFTILFHSLLFYTIVQRRFKWSILFVILLLLTELSKGIPFLTILCFILILNKKTKNYLKNIPQEKQSNLDLLDEDLL